MLRVFGVKDRKQPLPSLRDASDRMSRRSDMVNEKIERLDTELSKCREQIRKMRPGTAREAAKARAARVLKQKRAYEGQRDTLDGRSFRLKQVAFAAEDIIDSQQTGAEVMADEPVLYVYLPASGKVEINGSLHYEMNNLCTVKIVSCCLLCGWFINSWGHCDAICWGDKNMQYTRADLFQWNGRNCSWLTNIWCIGCV